MLQGLLKGIRQSAMGLLVLSAASAMAQSAIPYFKHVRPIQVQDTGKPNFIVIDETMWQNAQRSLADLRLYSNDGREIPYALRLERDRHFASEVPVTVVNKGTVNGNTQFTLDVEMEEYDNIHLALKTENYVAKASVEGANDTKAANWINLGNYSLYDFSKENLGANSSIRLAAPARYRYLRITIAGPVKAEEVSGAGVANVQEDKAKYIALSSKPSIAQKGKKTVVEWEQSERVPLERIEVVVDPAEVNFRRNTTLHCDERTIPTEDLTRVKLTRKERKIEYENLELDMSAPDCKRYRLEIDNGDDPPLRITAVKPMMLERRIYFDPRGQSEVKLYYGDEKLAAPVYDYAEFFEQPDSPKLAQAELKADAVNPAYTGRPDERPFTERYPAVLWVAMLLAVGLLGAWAMKGFKA